MRILTALFSLILISQTACADNPKVKMETTLGTLEIELFADKAPETVKNFLEYVDAGFYDGTLFHRVIPNFMIQGGGFTPDMQQKATRSPVINEADNGLKNTRDTIAMARTSQPHSATAQFFINVVDNPTLDFKNKSTYGWGYAVFGRVSQGMAVADKIRFVQTGVRGHFRDVPVQDVTIISIQRIQEEPANDQADNQ